MAPNVEYVLRDALTELMHAGVETPVLDAQVLLAHIIGCSRLDLIAHPERILSKSEIDAFEVVLRRRLAREPLAYIVGHKEFYGLEIDVRPGVLVPRPETELLVEELIKRTSPLLGEGKRVRFADVGCGSGAIAVALAVANPSAVVYATDTSPTALEITQTNAAKHGVKERVTVFQCNLVDRFEECAFDAIACNPPYVPTSQIESLQPEIRLYEPIEALDGGPDGLDIYRRLIPSARTCLKENGFLAVEVGTGQAGAVKEMASGAGYSLVETIRDLAGIERVVVAYK